MMIKIICKFAGLFLLAITFSVSADNDIWTDVKKPERKGFVATVDPYHKARLLQLDKFKMYVALEGMVRNNLAHRFATVDSSQNVSLPYPDGGMIGVELVRENLLTKSLAKKFPRIKTYRILPSNEITSGRVDMTPNGFHAMFQTSSGKTVFIDPKTRNSDRYVSYYKHDQFLRSKRFSCGATQSELTQAKLLSEKSFAQESHSSINYRIAIAATGEYTQANGGTVQGALSAIVTTLNRVNQVYEQNLGVHLTLVENNHLLIYSNPASDPFYADTENELLLQNQDNLDAVIGSNNYDLGHLFTTSGGGLAAIAGVCDQHRKGKGVSGIANPQNDSFNLDFVAHEIGHQLGATHTFNGTQGLCSGDTRESRTAFEPGSGSSIMAYAGYCGIDNLQSRVDAMFHIGSIKQIRSYAQTRIGSCGTRIPQNNQPPAVNAGKDYVIPARTPFELTGKATDPDADTLVYSWEQVDAGNRSALNEDKGNNSLFRVYMPSEDKTRHFPALQTVLNQQEIRGEKLPETSRKLHFNFVVKDGVNAAQSDETVIQVENTGERFSLYLPHSYYAQGKTYNVLWNVAKTDKSPINCQNVDISLSTDGGHSFPQELASNVANTGEAWVTIPTSSALTGHGRFKVKCSDNIFYALSYRDFRISSHGVTETSSALADQDTPEPVMSVPTVSGAVIGSISSSLAAKGGTFNSVFLLVILLMGKMIRKVRK